jgi:C-terminal processing protease CtpA/Prc
MRRPKNILAHNRPKSTIRHNITVKEIIMKKPFVIFIMLILSILSIEVFARQSLADNINANEGKLTMEQIKTDVALLKKAYETIHPGYTRYASKKEMSQAWAKIVSSAQDTQGMTPGDFYLQIQRTLSLIKCDHTKANLSKTMEKQRETEAIYLPFRFTWLNDRAFVTVADKQGILKKFDEIIAIDGRDIQSMANEVKEYIPYDGYTEWTRNSGISESLEFKGGAIDHFGALLWDIKPEASLLIRREDKAEETILVTRVNFTDWNSLASTQYAPKHFKDAVSFKPIDKDIAYLKVDTFVNYREPVEPSDIYDPIFKQIQEQKFGTVILDLRNNGGGSTEASSGLLANLISEKTKFKLDMRVNTLSFEEITPYLWTWDKRALDPYRFAFSKNEDNTYSLRSWFTDELDTIKPAKYAFTGKLIILTSNSNSSGSTNLMAVIKSVRKATLVGDKTGGSAEGVTAGLLFTLTLPESKIRTRIPFFRFHNNVKDFVKGMGLVPDVAAPMTVEAFIAGQDPAYEAAVNLVKQQL